MRRGEVWLVDFGEPVGHEPGYVRPAVIVSADETAQLGTPIVAPLTRTKRNYPTFVETEALGETSYVQVELLEARSIQRFIHQVGTLDGVTMVQVEKILRRLLKL